MCITDCSCNHALQQSAGVADSEDTVLTNIYHVEWMKWINKSWRQSQMIKILDAEKIVEFVTNTTPKCTNKN